MQGRRGGSAVPSLARLRLSQGQRQEAHDLVAYKVEHDADLDVFQARIADYGIDVEEVSPGHLECCGRALRFKLPSEHQMYLYAETECVGKAVGTTNPAPWPDGLKGCRAHWLDHVLLMCELNPEQGINKMAESTAFV